MNTDTDTETDIDTDTDTDTNTETDIDTDIEMNSMVDYNCVICLQENMNENELCVTDCTHKFCKTCLYNWLNTGKDSCPLCRCPISEFKYNNIIYKLVKIPRSTRQQNLRRHREQQNEIIRNTRLKYYYYLMLVSIIGLGNMYLVLNSNYVQLQQEYSACLRNNSHLEDLLENYNHGRWVYASMARDGNIYKCFLPLQNYINCFEKY